MDLQSILSGQYFTASAPNAAEKQIIVAMDVHATSMEQSMSMGHSKTVEQRMRMNVPGKTVKHYMSMNVPGEQHMKSNKERFYNGK